jgi:hypothetical protein
MFPGMLGLLGVIASRAGRPGVEEVDIRSMLVVLYKVALCW